MRAHLELKQLELTQKQRVQGASLCRCRLAAGSGAERHETVQPTARRTRTRHTHTRRAATSSTTQARTAW